MSKPSVEALIRVLQERRPRPTLRPLRGHSGFLVIEIEDSKPSCIVCSGSVPKGRHYTCGLRCQRRENLRVKELYKRRREAQRPVIPLSRKVRDALGGLFG